MKALKALGFMFVAMLLFFPIIVFGYLWGGIDLYREARRHRRRVVSQPASWPDNSNLGGAR